MMCSQFFDVLYDRGESCGFGWTLFDTGVSPADVRLEYPRVVLNPLLHGADRCYDPTEEHPRADRGRRADCNVTSFRNFLVEMDKIPLDDQWPIIRDIRMPFSTSVYSGGKSIHFVISLTDPVKNLDEYKSLAKMIYRAVPHSDRNCGNPSRFTRTPGVLRPDTGKMQSMLETRNRVSQAELKTWLDSMGIRPERKIQPTVNTVSTVLPRWVMMFLDNGVDAGERNATAYRAACDMAKCQISEEQIMLEMTRVPRLINNSSEMAEIRSTVKSACRKSKK